jgi:hypothetical protein
MNIEKADLPVIEIQYIEDEGHYVLVNQKQVARFDGPSGYDDATRCCAVMIQNEIKQIEQQQQQPYQIRDGNTGSVLSAHPTINDANEVAFSIENGLPYAGVPANALAVEFWQRQPDGQYRQMTMEQVGRELEAEPPELAREPVAPHQQYRALLEQISDLRYPGADAALRRKIEASIDKKVAEFMAERGELPTHAREQQRQQQQVPPPAVRQQQQRGMDRGYER